MLKILIVDDEYFCRQGMKQLIPYEEYGFTVCGEAKNGLEALEQVEALKPNIVLLDINMPKMDGIEFASVIKEKGINIKIIILTGYREFDYAKEALNLGVHDYLLKPLDVDELIATLLSLKDLIQKENNFNLSLEHLRKLAKDAFPIIKDRFLCDLFKGNITDEQQILDRLTQFGICITSRYYCLLSIEIDKNTAIGWLETETELWQFALSNITKEMFEGDEFKVLQQNMDERNYIILGFDDVPQNGESKILQLCERLRETVLQHLKFSITIALGNVYSQLSDTSAAYNEACTALKHKCILGSNTVIPFSSISELGITKNYFSSEKRSELIMNMRISDFKEIDSFINYIFDDFSENKSSSINQVFVIGIEMISICLEYMSESGHDSSKFFRQHPDLMGELLKQSSLTEMKNCIKNLVMTTLRDVNDKKCKKSQKMVLSVKKYIEENYWDSELSINVLAKNIFVNYGHLCYLFKKETGKTINNFITEYRMEKAKKLMDEGNHFIMDVANKVGYPEQGYFSKCFKKFYGISPSQYIESLP